MRGPLQISLYPWIIPCATMLLKFSILKPAGSSSPDLRHPGPVWTWVVQLSRLSTTSAFLKKHGKMKLFPAVRLFLLNINFVLGYPSFSFFSYILTENSIPYRNDCFKIHITKQNTTICTSLLFLPKNV